MKPLLSLLTFGCLLVGVTSITAAPKPNFEVKDGDSIAFLGDSITAEGAGSPAGYVHLVISGLLGNGLKVTPYPAGISGQTSAHMLNRVPDILNQHPTFLTVSCGVNDVTHTDDGVPLDQYKINLTSIVDQAQAAGVKVMLITSTMINSDPNSEDNQKLARYNEFLHQLAKEKNCLLADANADMQILNANLGAGGQLTRDGLHMNPTGNQMIALSVLRAFGMDKAQIEKARNYWLSMPEVAIIVPINVGLTFRQYQEFHDAAAKEDQYVHDYIARELVKSYQAPTPSPSPAK